MSKSRPAFTVVCGLLMFAQCALLIPLIGFAYSRFDPSVNTPAA